MAPPVTPVIPPVKCEVFASPIHGKGLRTLEAVPAGTVVLADPPLLYYPTSLIKPDPTFAQVMKITLGEAEKDERRQFLSLCNAFSGPPPEVEEGDLPVLDYEFMGGTCATNALRLTDTNSGVFELASRINHSCTPNAVFDYDATQKLLFVRTLVPLPAQAELLITYVDKYLPILPFGNRRAHLFQRYRFRCACSPACAKATSESELRRRRIDLLRQVWQSWRERHIKASDVMRIAKEVLAKGGPVEQEGLVALKAPLWEKVLSIAAAHSSIAHTRSAATTVLAEYSAIYGSSHPLTAELRGIIKDPRKHKEWGTRDYVNFDAPVDVPAEISALIPEWAGEKRKKKNKRKKKKAKPSGENGTNGGAEAGGPGAEESAEDDDQEDGAASVEVKA